MQLELFPDIVLAEREEQFQINEQNQFEVLLYANENGERDLHINVNSPEGNIIFSHINPEQEINVYINGNATVHGNLSLTGDLSISGQIKLLNQQFEQIITHQINDLEIKYDILKNTVSLNDKETLNYFEIGKKVVDEFKKYRETLTYNDFKDFFNY